MNIVVLDGYTANPGILPGANLKPSGRAAFMTALHRGMSSNAAAMRKLF